MKSLIGFAVLVGVAHAFYSSSDDVIELTPSNFNNEVIQDDSLWIIEFYAPWCGHCQALTPEWKKAATALKGAVKVGAVNADMHKSFGERYGIRGFPTIKIFGANKNKPEDYQGERQARGIVETAMTKLRSMVNDRMQGNSGGKRTSGSGSGGGAGSPVDVIELTDSNFENKVLNSEDMWLVEFFAPWCGHCKKLAPEWQSAATQLKGKVKLGILDATVHTVMASRYNVQGYPTIKYFPSGKKTESDAEDYTGGRVSSDIVNWALDKVAEDLPPPELIELTDEDVLKKACDDNQLCIISILPHILDCQSECRNQYKKTLKVSAEKFKKKQWGWVWAEAGAQSEVEDALGIGGFGYPAMAAMNSRKMKYAILKGSFSETGINEFLRALAHGRGSTAPVKNAQMPKVYKTEPWDGKDGQLPEEEDIDLSDVELDDLDGAKTEL